MTFPTTGILTDFTTQPDGGPPPTADYGNGIFDGDMLIDGGLCVGEFEGNADAPYTAQTFTLPCEAWAILGPNEDYAIVYLLNDAHTAGYVFMWLTDTYLLFDQDFNSIWTSGVGEFPALVEGGGLGLRANLGGSLELWITLDNVTWTLIHTETGLSLPNPATIGFGSMAVG